MTRASTSRTIETGPWGPVRLITVPSSQDVWLDVSSLHLELDEGTAGELLDALAEALRALAAPPHTGDTEQHQ